MITTVVLYDKNDTPWVVYDKGVKYNCPDSFPLDWVTIEYSSGDTLFFDVTERQRLMRELKNEGLSDLNIPE